MKKNLIIMVVFLFSLFTFVGNTEAACGAGVSLGDESLCMSTGCSAGPGCASVTYTSQSIKNGTAYTKQLDDGSIILVLDNYNGGSIKFYSGLGNPFSGEEIELIGDNYITNETGYGILSFVTGLNFVGDGTLTIKSKMPFVSTDADRQAATYFLDDNEVTTIKITAGENGNAEIVDEIPSSNNENIEVTPEEEKQENEVIDESTSSNDEKVEVSREEKNDLMTIALFVSSCISILCLIIIVVLILKNNKLKKINN